MTSVSTLRSFADVLMARPEIDVCYSSVASRVLASERCYKMSVDGVLSAENERTGLGLLQMQGKEGDCKATESEVLLGMSTVATGEVLQQVSLQVSRPTLECSPFVDVEAETSEGERAGLGLLLMQGEDDDHDASGLDVPLLLSPAMTGEVLSRHVSRPSLACSPSLTGHDPVLISPGDTLCDGGFSSDDDEDEVVDGKMEQLLPCLAELDQLELLLDGEEVTHENDLDDDVNLARSEVQLIADVIDADREAAMIGNLLAADIDDSPSSGFAIRCVADLFSLPAVPLLPTPNLPMPRAHAALPAPERRSSWLAAKPQLPAVSKAQRVLHKKMGLDFGDMPLVEATKEFTNTCKKAPLSDSAINGLRTLFRLNLPSMTAADEALIGLAGPGGSDFPPPTMLDVSA